MVKLTSGTAEYIVADCVGSSAGQILSGSQCLNVVFAVGDVERYCAGRLLMLRSAREVGEVGAVGETQARSGSILTGATGSRLTATQYTRHRVSWAQMMWICSECGVLGG